MYVYIVIVIACNILQYGGFQKWWYPQTDGLFNGQSY